MISCGGPAVRDTFAGIEHVFHPCDASTLYRRRHRQTGGNVAGAVIQQHPDTADVDLGLFIIQRVAARDAFVTFVEQGGTL